MRNGSLFRRYIGWYMVHSTVHSVVASMRVTSFPLAVLTSPQQNEQSERNRSSRRSPPNTDVTILPAALFWRPNRACDQQRQQRKRQKTTLWTRQTSPYERVDPEERAYQKLERAYTAKTEQAAAAAAAGAGGSKSKSKRAAAEAVPASEGGRGEGGAMDGDEARKKDKAGRWFD